MFGFGGKPKVEGAGERQGQAKSNQQKWEEMVATQKSKGQIEERKPEPLMSPDTRETLPKIASDDVYTGFDESTTSGVFSTENRVPQIDLEAEKQRIEQLDALRMSIKEPNEDGDEDERMAA